MTDKGLENYQDIIRIIFAYINQIKK